MPGRASSRKASGFADWPWTDPRRGRVAYHEAFGVLDPAAGAPMPKDAIFRIYSMTKPIATVAAMSLVEEGRLYLPGPGYGFGLGFAVRTEAGVAAFPSSVGEYYWGGAGGTYFWVDPRQELIVVFMMQSAKNRVPYRSVLRNLVYGAIVD